MQRRLVTQGGVAEARVRTGLDQQLHDLRTVGEVARPIGDQVQQGPEAAFAVHQPGLGQLGILHQEPPDRIDIATVDGEEQCARPRVVLGNLYSSGLTAHGLIIAEPALYGVPHYQLGSE